MRDKTPMNRREISDLAEDAALLMGKHGDLCLTREDARQILDLFPDLKEAYAILEAYLSIPGEERKREYACFGEYLEDIRIALLGPMERTALYDQEVAERTAKIPQESLMQEGYRENPNKSSHFYEHIATRMTG